MILDKLVEKKDLYAYIDLRSKRLLISRRAASALDDETKRHAAIRQIQGRILELKELKDVLSEDKLKDASKRDWRELRKVQL